MANRSASARDHTRSHGEQLRDFTYVDDAIEALLLCATAPAAVGSTYNLGSAEVVSLRRLAQLLTQIRGTGSYELVPFPAARKRIDIGNYHGDYALIESELGWRPRTTLESGLSSTLAFFDRHREYYWP